MKFTPTRTTLAIGAIAAALAAPMTAAAADDKATRADTATRANTAGSAPARNTYSDRELMKSWSSDKEMLQRELRLGQDKGFYTKALAERGFVITSINVDKPEAVEYEVVKDNRSYEVQIDFDAGKAKKLDVTTNVWRTDATKAALRGEKVPVATQYQKGNDAFSDRARMKGWTGEKERLEQALAAGQDKGFYEQQLKKLGYQVTSVNDREKDYLEYEVVKGDNSYEVQIDLNGGKAKKVDVTTNLWQSEATERALEASSR